MKLFESQATILDEKLKNVQIENSKDQDSDSSSFDINRKSSNSDLSSSH